jgi:Calcineurin-like phosphoesterase
MTAPQAFGTLQAPASWQTVELISDLHLQASETATFEAWRDYMARTRADAVLILGDLFEVWVGDDAVATDPFLQQCGDVLLQASKQRAVYFMPGNRDFLVGPAFLAQCGVQALADPTVLVWAMPCASKTRPTSAFACRRVTRPGKQPFWPGPWPSGRPWRNRCASKARPTTRASLTLPMPMRP